MNRNFLVLVIMCIGVPAYGADTPLDLELRQLETDAAGGTRQPFYARAEHEAQKLLEKYKSPEEQGRIYFALMDVYHQGSESHPEKAMQWAKKTLEYPLDPLKMQEAYSVWGDAVLLVHNRESGEKWAAGRKEAVVPFLRGLKELVKYELPEGPMAIPKIDDWYHTGAEGSPEYQRGKKVYDDQVKAARDAQMRNRLINARKSKLQIITYIYSRQPLATEELEQVAKEELKDDAAVKRVVDMVKANIQEEADKKAAARSGNGVRAKDGLNTAGAGQTTTKPVVTPGSIR